MAQSDCLADERASTFVPRSVIGLAEANPAVRAERRNATVIAGLIAQGCGGLDPAGAGAPVGAGQ
jgi:hypothetical protein